MVVDADNGIVEVVKRIDRSRSSLIILIMLAVSTGFRPAITSSSRSLGFVDSALATSSILSSKTVKLEAHVMLFPVFQYSIKLLPSVRKTFILGASKRSSCQNVLINSHVWKGL